MILCHHMEVIPILNWETETFCKPVLDVLIFGTMALFPTIFLLSTPSMWVAGICFGYGFKFVLIIGGVTIGVSLPYFLGSHFHFKIQVLLLEDCVNQAMLLFHAYHCGK
ncbi:hypothetical protein HanIR_Chr06g0256771 [Helianthus annuus]|nr:hypothetical protein HanIR_Chr06g0256771 [Helianthus annuus]